MNFDLKSRWAQVIMVSIIMVSVPLSLWYTISCIVNANKPVAITTVESNLKPESTPIISAESKQGFCCFVDASKEATASNVESCSPTATGAACDSWLKLHNQECKALYTEAVSHWEYRKTRWPDLTLEEERPMLKRYEVLLVPSVWGFTYKHFSWRAADGGVYVGDGNHFWEATQAACKKSQASFEHHGYSIQKPCAETLDVGERDSTVSTFFDTKTKEHETKMAEIHIKADTEMRSAKWHRCRDRADERMETAMRLNCRLRKKTHDYWCPADFVKHVEDLRQRAHDACDRACPTCQQD